LLDLIDEIGESHGLTLLFWGILLIFVEKTTHDLLEEPKRSLLLNLPRSPARIERSEVLVVIHSEFLGVDMVESLHSVVIEDTGEAERPEEVVEYILLLGSPSLFLHLRPSLGLLLLLNLSLSLLFLLRGSS